MTFTHHTEMFLSIKHNSKHIKMILYTFHILNVQTSIAQFHLPLLNIYYSLCSVTGHSLLWFRDVIS